jgi:hypothetical protein
MRIRRRGHAPDQCAISARGRPGSRADGGLALAPMEDRCQRMVAQLLSEFLKLHAACAGLPEFFEATASLAGYFPKPTAVDPKPPLVPLHRSGCCCPISAIAQRGSSAPRASSRAAMRVRPAGPYSITSSACASKIAGTIRPSPFAVFMLMTSSNRVGWITGKSAGFSPFRMRPT